jgi:hypothetical protein
MNKTLVWVSVGGLLLSGVCLAGAAALDDHWRRIPWNEMFHDDDEPRGPRDRTIIDRTLAWEAGEELSINVPAEVTFTDAPETSVVAHGPAWMVNPLEMDGDRLRSKIRFRNMDGDHLTLTISAPNVREFKVNGAAKLLLKDLDDASLSLEASGASDVRLENLKSDTLSIELNGASNVKADGSAGAVDLEISGAGNADLSALKARSANIKISGFGHVTAAPSDAADVAISGAGSVKLLTRPPHLTTKISGAGSITQADASDIAAAAAAPSAAPAAADKDLEDAKAELRRSVREEVERELRRRAAATEKTAPSAVPERP